VLRASGHDVQHVHEIGLTGASDHLVLERARAESRVLISADTDFGAILVRSQATMPSFLLLRRAANRRVIAQAAVILDNLEPCRLTSMPARWSFSARRRCESTAFPSAATDTRQRRFPITREPSLSLSAHCRCVRSLMSPLQTTNDNQRNSSLQ
jgi:predicted nuclease of predicted toxin-antitoxin system